MSPRRAGAAARRGGVRILVGAAAKVRGVILSCSRLRTRPCSKRRGLGARGAETPIN